MRPGEQLGMIRMGHDGKLYLPPNFAFVKCGKCHSSVFYVLVGKPELRMEKLACSVCGNTQAIEPAGPKA